jgi:hypothetical protein
MTCHEVRERIHECVDGELPMNQAVQTQTHLSDCATCRRAVDELGQLRKILATRARLSRLAQDRIWGQMQRKLRRKWYDWWVERWGDLCVFWRDLDRLTLWSKVSAVPVTLSFFVILLLQFPLSDSQVWTYPAFTVQRAPNSVFSEPVMGEVRATYTTGEIGDILDVAWKMPYEDSLSVLAEITPEGHAEIGDVLQYPKSQALLQAVNLTLRSTEFHAARSFPKPVVIYSFQKIDVYG